MSAVSLISQGSVCKIKKNAKASRNFVYPRITGLIEQQILAGILRTGDKLPSLRTLCQEFGRPD